MMKTYTLTRKQFLPLTIADAWNFFSSPRNLSSITPEQMKFKMIEITGDKMYPGQIIQYRISVIPLLPFSWVTEITHVAEPFYFVDEQRFGPYKWWHHQHHFTEVPGGVEMKDIVMYMLPYGIIGRLAHSLFVERLLNAIFEYRFNVLKNITNNQALKKLA